MSGHINNVFFSDPRAVQLRVNDDGELEPTNKDVEPHSAVRLEFFVLTETHTETLTVMSNTKNIAEVVSELIHELTKPD